MAASSPPLALVDVVPVYELTEKRKLQKHFARFDILFFLICTLVGLDTIGSVAANGPQGFTWLAILAVLAVGVLFYLAGAPTRRKMVEVTFDQELAHVAPETVETAQT